MSYFILTSGEDGTSIEQVSEAELLKRITPDKDGDTYYGGDISFLNRIPPDHKGCWGGVPDGAVLIIKGEIIQPKAKAVAMRYEL